MIVFDCSVMCLTIYPNAGVPSDFKTNKPIQFAKERVDGLIADIEQSGDVILIPTPTLAEVLVVAAPNIQEYIEELRTRSCFRVVPFGERAAIEVAVRTKIAKKKGSKKEGVQAAWDKVKYDRQIVAIAKVEGASVIYSTDEHIHTHGELWGIPVRNISDLPVPHKQTKIFDQISAPQDSDEPED